jgi:CubicO group peptidase (beta-lactamase class C family)
MWLLKFIRVRSRTIQICSVLWVALGLIGANAQASAKHDMLTASLRALFADSDVPALAVGVWQNGALVYELTQGVQRIGMATLATPTDRWHLGSCAKAMTAAMILRLVDRGVLRLDQAISTSLPAALLPRVHPELHNATLRQLLSHSSGVEEADLLTGLKNDTRKRFLHLPNNEDRLLLQAASYALEQRPTFLPGKAFQYSNYGYITAAVVATHATGKSWTQLMREEVFEPLHMHTAGFSVPRHSATVTQPRGHRLHYKWLVRPYFVPIEPNELDADLPSFYGPAGLIHANLHDWAKFCHMLLDGARGGSTYLTDASFRAMLTPKALANSAEYGLGVQVIAHPKSKQVTLMHTGSNGLSRARFLIDVSTQRITLMAANSGTDAVDSVFDEVQKRIANY